MDKIYEVVQIKQVVKELPEDEKYFITSPEAGAQLASSLIGDEDREVMLVFCLNVKRQVVAIHRAHVGTVDMAVVNVREIFKCAILSNSSAIILAHNHPSGNHQNSREDVRTSQKVALAGQIMQIELLDSLIVTGGDAFTSLREKGYFDSLESLE